MTAFPTVQGRCPACRATSLFLGDGGHVTCSRIDCPDPSAADDLLSGEPAGVPGNRVWLTRSTPSDAWQPIDFNASVGELLDGQSLDTVRAVFGLLGRDLLLKVQAPAHNGPTVAEATANDRRWWNGEKEGE